MGIGGSRTHPYCPLLRTRRWPDDADRATPLTQLLIAWSNGRPERSKTLVPVTIVGKELSVEAGLMLPPRPR